MRDLKHFIFWCQKVIPLVYDESLSYYEVLCKCVDYINKLIDSDKEIVDNLDELKAEIAQVQEWIDNYNEKFIVDLVEESIKNYLALFVVFKLNDGGYFVAEIPHNWTDIQFNTTGLDIDLELQPEYGHLVLSY